MLVNEEVIRRSEERAADKGAGSPTPAAAPAPEEVSERVRHAGFAGAVLSKAELERFIGANDLVDENYLERALLAARAVCRLSFTDADTGRRAYATGFMVAPRLLITNWHVFPAPPVAAGALAEFDYKLDIRGLEVTPTRFRVRPDVYHCANQDLDYALVAVDPIAVDNATPVTSFGYHRLVEARGKLAKNEPITIIQHPAGGRRQIALRENELIEEPTDDDLFLWYRSDTAKGSSGAPAFNDSWQIVALHHSGKARKDGDLYVLRDGRRVPSLNGIEETAVDWIANEGLRASVLCAALRDQVKGSAVHDELIAALEGVGDVMTRSMNARDSVAAPTPSSSAAGPVVAAGAVGAQGAAIFAPGVPGSGLFQGVASLQFHAPQIYIAQQIVVQGTTAAAATDAGATGLGAAAIVGTRPAEALEKLVQPIIDRRYSNRKGYIPHHIKIDVPWPRITDMSLVSKLENGKPYIPYQHFSVVMNKKRRLALFTASNVDASAKMRTPDPDADYGRKALTGLDAYDLELWRTDPRIPEEHQLPDVFFTKDRQAFDKGHIVRRDDVCWGRTYAQLRRANGDTFHTTNCSPQVLDFNRSNKQGVWGQLENMILKQAKTEKLALFAGPVFEEEDDEFHGVDQRGPIVVQIPRRYWKVVCANAGGRLEAFAFLLEQDLSGVALEPEFAVDADWLPHMIAIADLQDLLAGITFEPAILAADQYGQEHGTNSSSPRKLRRCRAITSAATEAVRSG